MIQVRPSEQMRGLGVVQRGAPVLAESARAFDLPAEREAAEQVIGQLFSAMERIGQSTRSPREWDSRHHRSRSAEPPPWSSPPAPPPPRSSC